MTIMGTPRLRKEDPKLLTGEGKYVDDIHVAGQLWMGMVRSPMAHATIRTIDTSAAQAMDGVHAVYTGAELNDMGLWAAPLPCAWPVTEDMVNPPHYPVAADEVHHVGELVAVVLADSRYGAADAAELVEVDYDLLPVVASVAAARDGGDTAHSDLESNKAYHWPLIPDPDALDAAFASAVHTVKAEFVQQRLIPSAMEPRGVLAIPSPAGGEITLYSATQVPHILKVMIAATTGLPEGKLRIIAPAVGGGFGAKLNINPDEILAVTLANKLGKPVRWTEGRSEAAFSTHQGRGQLQTIELAADADGKLAGVRVHLDADMGAYMMLITPGVPLLGSFLYTGVYDVPAFGFTCDGYFTNLTPTDAYRGAGRPEASYAIERAMDILAGEVGVGPDEIRRRNYLAGGAAFENLETASTLVFDSGNYSPNLDAALEMAGYTDLRADQAARRDAGGTKHLGIGLCTYVEICGLAPSRALGGLNYGAGGWEHATVRFLPTGKVEVVSGSTPHGQGHETSWSMIVADKLGVDPDDVTVLHSDTAISPLGLDTYGSRSLSVGGVAIAMACDKVIDKAREIAAHQLEARCVHRPQPAGRYGAEPAGAGELRSAQLRLPLRHPRGGGRGGRGDRQRRVVELHRHRRLRQPGQPVDRGGPGSRRHRPGCGPGAVGGGGVRRGRQLQEPVVPRLPGAIGGRCAKHQGRFHHHTEHQQPAGGQGGRRSRHHRLGGGGDQCGL